VPSSARAAITSKARTTRSFFRLAREHVDRDHPDMERSDQQLRERIAAAYDVVTAR
jgi:hypothetical protein